jgi:hypothetical protein
MRRHAHVPCMCPTALAWLRLSGILRASADGLRLAWPLADELAPGVLSWIADEGAAQRGATPETLRNGGERDDLLSRHE